MRFSIGMHISQNWNLFGLLYTCTYIQNSSRIGVRTLLLVLNSNQHNKGQQIISHIKVDSYTRTIN
jgi:hypothetical protein